MTEERQARALQYRALIIKQFCNLRLEGLSTGTKPIVLPLAEVYVHLRAVAEVPEAADAFTPEEHRLLKLLDEQRAGGHIDEAELREAQLRLDALRHERWTRDRLERFPIAKTLGDPEQRGLVILGDPGSGKSTLLQFLALSFAEGPDVAAARLQVNGADADRLPIFAPLAAYDDMLDQIPGLTIPAFLSRYYDQRRAIPGLGPVFDQAIAEGRALILLDGLDEVIDEGHRHFVAEQVTRFVQTALVAGNRVVLTSRVYGYRAAPLAANLPHITVLDFRQEEIAVFARQWFRALTRWEAGGSLSPQAELDAQAEERQLLEEIGRNPGVERLAANPLLLTMLALLRRQAGVLPQRRIKLYDLYVTTLIESWEENRSRGARLRSGATRVDLTEAENALIELALWLQQHRPSGTATARDLLDLLTVFYLWQDQGLRVNTDRILPPQHRQAAQRAEQFLRDMRQYSGLLIERGQGAFGFRHLTFQEYFAGRALARMLADERWVLLAPNLHSGRWREPLLLCTARLGITENRSLEASALVTQVLEAGSGYEAVLHRDLFLAADCAADDTGLSLSLLQTIADKLWKAYDSPVLKVWRAAAKRLHGLALLRAGARPKLPVVQQRLAEELLRRVAAGQRPVRMEDVQVVSEARELLARLPLTTDVGLRVVLLDCLADDSPSVRAAAVGTLGGLAGSDPAIRVLLVDRLADDSPSVRAAAVGVLGGQAASDSAICEALVNRLTDDDNNVRAAAVGVLGGQAASDSAICEALVNRLTDDDNNVRAAVVGVLGGQAGSDPAIRAALVNRLVDDWPSVQVAAVGALGGLAGSDPAIRAALVNCLADDWPSVRAAAVGTLGGLAGSDPAIRAALLDRLANDSPSVRAAAVGTLGGLAGSDADIRAALVERLADDSPSVRAAAVGALGGLARSDADIRAALLEASAHVDWRTRQVFLQGTNALLSFSHDHQHAVQCLTNTRCQEADPVTMLRALGGQAASDSAIRTALLDRLIHDRPDMRAAAVGALSGLAGGDPAILAALVERLADDSPSVRVAAVRALSRRATSDAAIRTALVERLADHRPDVRVVAVRALSGEVAGDPALYAALVERLADHRPDVRAAAVGALAGQAASDPAICAALFDRLADDSPSVRAAAVRALSGQAASDSAIRAGLLDHLIHDRPDVRAAAVGALSGQVASDPAIRAALVERLADDWPSVRAAAVRALSGQVASDSAILAALVERLIDGRSDVRAAAVRALNEQAATEPAIRAALLDCLIDDRSDLRGVAVGALSGLAAKYPAIRAALLDRLADSDKAVRAAAVRALGGLAARDPTICAALLDRLADSDNDVRAAVVRTLGGLVASDPAIRAALVAHLADDKSGVRTAIVGALSRLAATEPDICAALVERLTDDKSDVRTAAVRGLSGLAATDAAIRAALVERLTDDKSDVRTAAVRGLSGLAASDAAIRAALVERLADDRLDVRAAAADQLLPLFTSDPGWLPVLMLMCAPDLQHHYPPSAQRLSRRLAEHYAAQARTDPHLLAAIIAQLGAVDWRLRVVAAQILAAAGKEALRAAQPQLLAALEDERGLDSWPARLDAAALLLNNDQHGEQALAITLEALTYGANTIFPIPSMALVRKQAALTLGTLKALHHRRDVANRIAGLLTSETDPQVLDSLYDTFISLAAGPEPE